MSHAPLQDDISTADSTTSVRVWWDTAWWDTAENEGTFSNQHKSL